MDRFRDRELNKHEPETLDIFNPDPLEFNRLPSRIFERWLSFGERNLGRARGICSNPRRCSDGGGRRPQLGNGLRKDYHCGGEAALFWAAH